MIATIIVISLTLVFALGQICSPSANLDQISTGSYTFSLLPFSSRVQCFNATLDTYFASARPQVAVGISGVGNFQSDLAGIDFSLRSLLSTSNTQLSLVLIVNNGSWVSLSANYLVTSRPQFLLGNALSNGNLLATCTKQQSYPISFSVPGSSTISNQQSLGILILLSGIRTPSSGFSLQFTQPSIDLSLRQINTSVLTNATKQIQLLQIYYVIVDLSSFVANGYNYNFSLTSVVSDYSLSGVVAINSQSFQYAFFAINRTAKLSCVGFSCSSCQTTASCTSLGGQATGSQCIKCSFNQIIINGVCACSNGQVLINGVCQTCPPGTVFNASLNACASLCTTNQVWSNGACQCIPGYTLISGKCQQLKCGTNEYYYQGICNPCPSNSVSSSDQSGCVCVLGYTYVELIKSCSLISNPISTLNTPNLSASIGGSNSTSGNSGTSGIYTLSSGSFSTFSSSSSSNTGSFYSSLPLLNSFSSTPISNCSTGVFYSNGSCRNQATITIFQKIQFYGQNIIYVGVSASNLPEKLTPSDFPNLIIAKITNNPPNASINITISQYNKQQWLIIISYSVSSAVHEVTLSWNPVFSPLLTPQQMSYVLKSDIIPDQVAKFNIAITPTNNLAINDDKLPQLSVPQTDIASKIFSSQVD